MKTIKTITLVTIAILGFTSCSNDDDSPQVIAIEAERVVNMNAPQTGGQGTGQEESGDFTKFNFSTGTTTTSDTDWDIAFRGTRIIVNGGSEIGITDEPIRNGNAAVYILDEAIFDEVNEVDETLFIQDSSDGYALPAVSGQGWYNYDFMNNLISARAGVVLVFRTRDNRFAKLNMVSYYRDLDASNPANVRYYTFDYVYQPNEGVTTFE